MKETLIDTFRNTTNLIKKGLIASIDFFRLRLRLHALVLLQLCLNKY